MGKHLLSKKALLCSKKVFRKQNVSKKPLEPPKNPFFSKKFSELSPLLLEASRVRLSISGVKSGTNPETPRKRSQSEF